MNTLPRNATLLLSAALLVGCQTPVVMSAKPGSPGAGGLVYALPKAQVLLEASRTVITAEEVDKARKAAAQAGEVVTAAAGAEAAAKGALKEAETVLAAGAATVKAELTQKRDVADAVARVRTAQLEAARLMLKEARKRQADLEGHEGSYEMSAALKLLPVVPDVAHRYAARLSGDGTRDDSLKLATVNGLLSSAGTESTGQVAAILVNIASAIAGAKAPSAGWKLNTYGAPFKLGEPAPPCKPFATSLVFDPTDTAGRDAAIEQLKTVSQGSLALSVAVPAAPLHLADEQQAREGLVYRAPVPVNITVASQPSPACPGEGTPSSTVLNATVPDSRSSYVMPVTAGAFTKTRTAFEFKDGMPTAFNVDRPSQLAAITRIPVDILKAIVEVPASLIKLRVDYDSQAAALTDAEVKQLKAQLDLINARNALKDAQPAEPK